MSPKNDNTHIPFVEPDEVNACIYTCTACVCMQLLYVCVCVCPTAEDVPVVPLNHAALSAESPFERDTVEGCVRETLLLLLRAVAGGRAVLFTFQGVGVLCFRHGKVKMKFYRDFISSMDGSGRLLWALSNVSLSDCLIACLSACLYACLSDCLCYLTVQLSVCLSVCVCLSLSVSVCPHSLQSPCATSLLSGRMSSLRRPATITPQPPRTSHGEEGSEGGQDRRSQAPPDHNIHQDNTGDITEGESRAREAG